VYHSDDPCDHTYGTTNTKDEHHDEEQYGKQLRQSRLALVSGVHLISGEHVRRLR